MLVVFDMDGVLVDTLPLVRRAYGMCGVRWRPGHWTGWCTPEQHLRKQSHYKMLLAGSSLQRLPCSKLYEAMQTKIIVTTADPDIVPDVLFAAGLTFPDVLHAGVMDKGRVLRALGHQGIIIEDTPLEVEGWTTLLTSSPRMGTAPASAETS